MWAEIKMKDATNQRNYTVLIHCTSSVEIR
jgi:hypothetical protein